jgi:DNA-binding IclR family transcriptional regulator
MTTTYRILKALVRRGYVVHAGRGNYRLGAAVLAIANGLSIRAMLPAVARAQLQALSKRTRAHAHLGVWEDGMVTYLVKQPYGQVRLHSAEGMQLEAYCSAIGKVLLCGLPEADFARYVADGGFVALTDHTITDPERLRQEIELVRARGWAVDAEESAPGLCCVAAPVRDGAGRIVAAISVSRVSAVQPGPNPHAVLPSLLTAANAIGQKLFTAT